MKHLQGMRTRAREVQGGIIPGGGGQGNNKQRLGRKQKVSSSHDVSCNEYSGISA